MFVQDFTYLLQHPDQVITPEQTQQLEDIVSEYPYFQAARAIQLKGLKNQNSFKYNKALKVTAAYTADRDILFEFITSKEFSQNTIADTLSGKTAPLVETDIILEEIQPQPANGSGLIDESKDKPLSQNDKDANQILSPKLSKTKTPKATANNTEEHTKAREELELGQPLAFTKKEKYSFGEWLQLTAHKTIERKTNEPKSKNIEELEDIDFPLEEGISKKKKFALIDKFIASSPKIVPKENPIKIKTKGSAKFDNKELMTETLAKVYLEQKNYKNAIQAYKILSLKYPEKSGFFAARIKAVEKIKQENTQ